MPGFSYREPAARSKSLLRQSSGRTAEDSSDDANHHGPSTPQTFGRGIIHDMKSTIGTHWRKE
eukprot:scaffold320_cov122-Cylindrotheca_fusiformis.AAC.1